MCFACRRPSAWPPIFRCWRSRRSAITSRRSGQRAYNGVALLSNKPPEDSSARPAWATTDDSQARYIEASFRRCPRRLDLSAERQSGRHRQIHLQARLDGAADGACARIAAPTRFPFVLAGDYNICPTDDDVYDPVAFRDDALCRLEARSRSRALLYLGLTDAYRVFHREPHRYTFWDYQAGRWNRDEGLRIDHLLLSPHAADRIAACDIDKKPRGKERASDHTPIWCELAV